jgi:2,3-bisphosphoglycerate-dependent phosphoglycerate mutase
MQLVLVRHGLPERMEVAVGVADPPLAALGLRQGQAVAEFLADEPVDAVVSSPMLRARQTAQPLADVLGLPVQIVDDLAEYDSGQRFYVPVHQMHETHAELWQQMLRGDLPDFVDLDAFRGRVTDALEQVIAAHPGRGKVAVFCHAGVINVALGGYLGIARALPFPVDYTGVSRITASRSGRRAVISVNETAHVRTLLDVEGAAD